MKIGLVSTALPLVQGGGRFIVDWLNVKLLERGHKTELIYIPYTDEITHILPQMVAIRAMKLDDYFERVITLRPPAHMVRHPRKIVWFIHHIRMFYDLWQTPYCSVNDDVSGRALRSAIITADNVALQESYQLFTNSLVVGARIKRFNGLDSTVLYPPILHPEIFRSGNYGNEIVSVCRMEHHKRQHLLIEAMANTRTLVRLRLCGTSLDHNYVQALRDTAHKFGVADRVVIEERWITEKEKADRLEHALASAYVPFDEDSYGYPTIEAAHARRCTITVSDSGGVSEFVDNGKTGIVAEPNAKSIADAMDRVYENRSLASQMGCAAHEQIAALGIDWDTVIKSLLA